MKKTIYSLVVLLGICAFSCKESDSTDDTDDTPAKEKVKKENKNAGVDSTRVDFKREDEGFPTSLNIRYIDMDSVARAYNFALDVQEMTIKEYSKLQSISQSKENEINKFGKEIEDKMRSNSYLSQESYDADMNKINKMQQDAQKYLSQLQRDTEEKLAKQQMELSDSIESFIRDYNNIYQYDAILFKAAGAYFNPSLDITAEIIEGLNARYNRK